MPIIEIPVSEETHQKLLEASKLSGHRFPAMRLAGLLLDAACDIETPESINREMLQAAADTEQEGDFFEALGEIKR